MVSVKKWREEREIERIDRNVTSWFGLWPVGTDREYGPMGNRVPTEKEFNEAWMHSIVISKEIFDPGDSTIRVQMRRNPGYSEESGSKVPMYQFRIISQEIIYADEDE